MLFDQELYLKHKSCVEKLTLTNKIPLWPPNSMQFSSALLSLCRPPHSSATFDDVSDEWIARILRYHSIRHNTNNTCTKHKTSVNFLQGFHILLHSLNIYVYIACFPELCQEETALLRFTNPPLRSWWWCSLCPHKFRMKHILKNFTPSFHQNLLIINFISKVI